ncbi:FkbM family methyltransferase [Tropicimonas sp. TH_r6]|uniref:FkbM family methyltransferase n=1 Tax=Tropicimonas sp. TH_r6 TaxID=3082085 RepID=UPI002953C65F|nr:FkbM family methyltransferase [Tropicimonas sp. TH_r6]MDV7144303.1 FkbM family methyltransferase [Tropicimonas sp. TH_r6]
MRNRTTITANRMLFRLLPDWAYLRMALRLIPAFDPRRRGLHTQVERFGEGYVARNANGVWHFNSAFKIGRYLYRDPADGVMAAMMRKYCDGFVEVTAGDIVVDIGANVGEFTLAAAARQARVIAVEPDDSAFRCLKMNTADADAVTCVNALIGDTDGTRTLYLSPDFSDSSVIAPTEAWTDTLEVRSIRLASLMDAHGVKRIDFLKLEAEGFEPEILDAAREVLSRIGKIAIDASPERNGEATDLACTSILTECGFRVWQRGWMVYALNETEAKQAKGV